MIRARMFAIACGYEDCDDLDVLRFDPAFKVACGRLAETGDDPMSQPTLSRLENASEIVAIAAAGLWNDGRDTTRWSNVDPANLARMILVLDEKQRRDAIHDADLEP